MLFNSYAFIFLFLPVALLGYFVLGRRSDLATVVWLTIASLVYSA
jgi:alginate O-acetyltransferase complex protein AlgI